MKYYILLLIALTFQFTSCQEYGILTYVDHLPKTLDEISGMAIIPNSDLLLAINDSGGAAEVYIYDNNRDLYTITSPDLKNVDWEDLATYTDPTTSTTYLYIADTGNNYNERRDLQIYEVDVTNLKAQDLKNVKVRKIPFSYNDQKDYPPKKSNRLYDCEAMIRLGDYFYLFSKNRGKDFNGKTQIHRLPVDGSSNIAEHLTEIEICNDKKDCKVTSADVNSKGDIALLTADKIFILSAYDKNFKHYKIDRIDLNYKSQKESIIFKEDDLLWISDEETKHKGRNLFQLRLN